MIPTLRSPHLHKIMADFGNKVVYKHNNHVMFLWHQQYYLNETSKKWI